MYPFPRLTLALYAVGICLAIGAAICSVASACDTYGLQQQVFVQQQYAAPVVLQQVQPVYAVQQVAVPVVQKQVLLQQQYAAPVVQRQVIQRQVAPVVVRQRALGVRGPVIAPRAGVRVRVGIR